MCKATKIPKLPSECLAVTVVMSIREKSLSVLYLGFFPSCFLSISSALHPSCLSFPQFLILGKTIKVRLDLESFLLPLTPAVVFGGSGGSRGFPGGSDNKEPTYNAGDLGLIPGSGRSPGEGNGNPLQYSSYGQRSLVGYSPWGRKESDTAERGRGCVWSGLLD